MEGLSLLKAISIWKSSTQNSWKTMQIKEEQYSLTSYGSTRSTLKTLNSILMKLLKQTIFSSKLMKCPFKITVRKWESNFQIWNFQPWCLTNKYIWRVFIAWNWVTWFSILLIQLKLKTEGAFSVRIASTSSFKTQALSGKNLCYLEEHCIFHRTIAHTCHSTMPLTQSQYSKETGLRAATVIKEELSWFRTWTVSW